MKQAIILANSTLRTGMMVQRTLEDIRDADVIAADGGAKLAQALGLSIHVIIGDMDSVDTEQLAQLETSDTIVLRYPPDKNETDLELALKWAIKQGYDTIRILGAFGGRIDQSLANIYLLALPELQQVDTEIVVGNESIRLVRPGNHTIAGQAGDTISLMSLTEKASGIRTAYLKYPLNNEDLPFGTTRGMSNVMLGDMAQLRFESGLLLMSHTIGRA